MTNDDPHKDFMTQIGLLYILKTFYIYEPQSRRGRKGKKKREFYQSFNLAIELVEMQGW